jgi:hypothetical protein
MEIIVLSSIVTILFIVFGVVVYKELSKAELKVGSAENSPRAQLIKFVGSIFDQTDYKNSKPETKELILTNIGKTISDMEDDGVYFPDEVKEQLKKRREELNCEYSGLPSVKSYEEETIQKFHELSKGLH